MRARIYHSQEPVFVTGTKHISEALVGNVYEILVYELDTSKPRITALQMRYYRKHGHSPFTGFIPAKKMHAFIQRFFPTTEEELKSLLLFRKKQKRGHRILSKQRKAPVAAEALFVA